MTLITNDSHLPASFVPAESAAAATYPLPTFLAIQALEELHAKSLGFRRNCTPVCPRALLEAQEPGKLLTVASGTDVASAGINRASRSFRQVPLLRACFDDTKVR